MNTTKEISTLAPIVLFAFNRPEHTRKTLESLSRNEGIKDSELIIYLDGSKDEMSHDERDCIKQTKDVCQNFQSAKNIKIVERPTNFGLAKNIIEGVSEIINEYGIVIVLEDDLELSPQFLNYMNQTLDFYSEQEDVFHISGYWFPVIDTSTFTSELFFTVRNMLGLGNMEASMG